MQELHILHAGCVSKQMKDSAARFKQNHPDVDVILKPGGSVDCIRRLMANERCDLIVLADDAIIQSMMMPDYADGYLVFAGNSMAVMAAKEGATISEQTWKQTLLDPNTTFGHFDPSGDPGGYRAVMACMLADNFEPGLSQKLLEHPGRIVLKTGQEPRPQYMFTYLSGARNSGKPYANLPDEMNLSCEELNSLYQTVEFDLGESRVCGSAISHALAIPFASQNQALAKEFVREFLKTDFAQEGFIAKTKVVGKDPLA